MIPTFIFLPEVISLHRQIHHPGNQLTMALDGYYFTVPVTKNASFMTFLEASAEL